jgi:uncharacterized Zn finger protein
MSYYDYDGFPEYIPVAEKRRRARESVEKLRKKNPDISPVIISGSKLTRTWWGKSWNANLERYSDYANRIGRGRSYVRHGAVLDLKITEGEINALVKGSAAKPYQVNISIQPLARDIWEALTNDCAGKIDSMQELLEGKFPKALSELFTAEGKGLFPAPKEISLKCSCPDWAIMCKHVAAVLYGVGARLDDDPSLFFVLRKVNINDLISETINKKARTLLEKSKAKSRRVIEDTDISDMFGIRMETGTASKAKESAGKKKPGESEAKKASGKRLKHSDKDRLLIAPCGMNCHTCAAYLREKNKCPGCRGSDLKKPVTRVKCKIKTCEAFAGNRAAFCSECLEFPCVNLKKLDKRYRTKYNMSMIENLESIKKLGIDIFIRNETTRWLCSACGGTICVHKGYCYNCKTPHSPRNT